MSVGEQGNQKKAKQTRLQVNHGSYDWTGWDRCAPWYPNHYPQIIVPVLPGDDYLGAMPVVWYDSPGNPGRSAWAQRVSIAMGLLTGDSHSYTLWQAYADLAGADHLLAMTIDDQKDQPYPGTTLPPWWHQADVGWVGEFDPFAMCPPGPGSVA